MIWVGRAGRSGEAGACHGDRTKDRAFFLLGFAKNERENVSSDQLVALRKLAEVWLRTSDARITDSIQEGVLQEVFVDDEST